ncbi:MAG: hypothetical protein JSS05_13145 [Proteobacteria bacterium]|nr:hypothetical protein [Pseudomonadota bacterium]
MRNQSTIERAFDLADGGRCRSVADIRAQLKQERHDAVDAHLSGMTIQRQLKQRMLAALR